jgi:hypothetical protein
MSEGMTIRLKKIPGVTKGSVLQTPYYFQCPPMEEFGADHGFTHSRYQTLDGEFTRRGGRELVAVTFRTVVVEWGRFTVTDDWDVEALVDDLTEICDKGWPFDLLATHKHSSRAELHIDAVLERIRPSEVAGETDARYLDLSFLEWRDPRAEKRRKKKTRKGNKKLPFTIELLKDGTFKSPVKIKTADEDLTFSDIAKYAYGKPSYAKYVAEANDMPNWGYNTPIIKHTRFKKNGGKITVPEVYLVGELASSEVDLGTGA